MDKYEYKHLVEQIQNLIDLGEYAEAAAIADKIDWRRVRSVMTLGTISDLYKINNRYEDARDIMLLAYDRKPENRQICYSLCELYIKTGEPVEAAEFYKEFEKLAPKDPGRYILKYKLYDAYDVSLDEKIEVLEKLKDEEYQEKWMYELANLYHRRGLGTKCVEVCDELILWFGTGKYVNMAMELKMLHEPLTPAQQKKYDNRFLAEQEEYAQAAQEDLSIAQAHEQHTAKMITHEWKASDVEQASEDQMGQTRVFNVDEVRRQTGYTGHGDDVDIQVKTVGVGQYDTINLQAELAEGLREVLEKDTPSAVHAPEDSFQTTRILPTPVVDTDSGPLDLPVMEDVEDEDLESEPVQPKVPEKMESSEVFFETDGIMFQDENGYFHDASERREDQLSDQVMAQMRKDDKKSLLKEAMTAQPPERIAKVLTQEADGQLKLVVPEHKKLEKQITGQISIDDIRAEWEMMKQESQAKQEEETRQQMLKQTGRMFTEFEEAMRDNILKNMGDDIDPMTLKAPAQSSTQNIGAGAEWEMEDISHDEFHDDSQGQANAAHEFAEALREADRAQESAVAAAVTELGEAAGEAQAQVEEAQAEAEAFAEDVQAQNEFAQAAARDILSAVEAQAEEVQTAAEEVQAEAEAQVEEVQTAAEEAQAEVEAQTEFAQAVVEAQVEEIQTAAEAQIDAAEAEVRNEFAQAAAAVEEIQAEAEAQVEEVQTAAEDVQAAAQAQAEEAQAEEEAQEGEPDESLKEAEELARAYTESRYAAYAQEQRDAAYARESGEEASFEWGEESFAAASEEAATESEAVAEAPIERNLFWRDDSETEMAEPEAGGIDYEDLPQEDIVLKETSFSEKRAIEAERMKEFEEEPEDDQITHEIPQATRSLSPEEEALYAPWIRDDADREQLVSAIDNISMAAYVGNLIITGEPSLNTLDLAKKIISEVKQNDSNLTGKVAKIPGQSLNNRDVSALMDSLQNGALIIEKAASMSDVAVENLYRNLQRENFGVVVVLLDTRKNVKKFLRKHEELRPLFNVRVDILPLSNEALADFARQYAKDHEYSIDNLGMLALHTKIDELQTANHAVTCDDVKEIMDDAIDSASRKTLGHFFDIIFGRRYDEEDMIIITEKDFMT